MEDHERRDGIQAGVIMWTLGLLVVAVLLAAAWRLSAA